MLTKRHPKTQPMILRTTQQFPTFPAAASVAARPAYQVFVAHQQNVQPPYLPIPQPTHARLAGSLAQALLPEIFGSIPAEVIEAVRQHDYGWIGSDLAQLAESRNGSTIRSFPQLGAEEAVPAWDATVRLAEACSPLIGVLVNRHFCFLSDDDNPLHRQFREEARRRREPVEAALEIPAPDLDRWTAALGVCDLLSLYLCSGCTEPVEFPLCHPADAEAREHAEKTTLRWEDGVGQWSRPLFHPETRVSQMVAALEGDQKELSWQIS